MSGSQLDIGAYEASPVTVTFDPGAHATRVGGGVLSQQVFEGGSATEPTLSLQPGWAFSGWDVPLTNVWAARTITAQYTDVFTNGSICHVKVGGTGSGATWAEATGDFQGAIEAIHAVGGGQVWVAEGTYKPDSWPNGGTMEREKHFALREGVAVYGGFAAIGEPGAAQREPSMHPVVFSGDIGALGVAADNVYHVFKQLAGSMGSGRMVLDGCIVCNGNASDAPNGSRNGGGIYSEAVLESYVGCVFQDNLAVEGGGLCLAGPQSPEPYSRRLANCVIRGNHATSFGGGIRIWSGSVLLQNLLIIGNLADDSGGGVSYRAYCHLTNCTIYSNTAGTRAGGIDNFGITAGIHVANSLMWGNTAPTSPQVGAGWGFPEPSLSSCLVEGGYPHSYDGRCLNADPLFQNEADPDGADNRWFTDDDGLRLQDSSPAAQWARADLLTAGLADLDGDGNTSEALPLDAAGAPRVVDGQPEPGAYEINPTLVHLPYWRTIYFPYQDRSNPAKEASLWGNAADPDGDGIPNIGEYALMKHPLLADAPPVYLIEPYPGWQWLVCEHYLAKNRPDVS